MSTLFLIIGAAALVLAGSVLIGAKSAIHEILAGIAALTGVVSLGFAAILAALDKIAKTATTLDQNNWTVGKAIWRQLHDPTGKNPEPKADGD